MKLDKHEYIYIPEEDEFDCFVDSELLGTVDKDGRIITSGWLPFYALASLIAIATETHSFKNRFMDFGHGTNLVKIAGNIKSHTGEKVAKVKYNPMNAYWFVKIKKPVSLYTALSILSILRSLQNEGGE